jgi:signal transduction histidine kinase
MERLAERLSMPVPVAIGASLDDPSTDDPEAYFARWEAMLADTDEPTADELEIAGLVLERYTAPVDDEAGARIGRLVVLRDVTREREVDQLKSDLMATVSHELRTPLASVLGYAELLRTRRLDQAARDEILGTVHREAKRLSSLIDDFLDVQAIERDQLTLLREPFSVTELLQEQVRTFAGQSAAHRVTLTPCDGPAIAVGDRRRIAQVVANLLSNAIKYSPGGGDVGVAATCTPDFVRVLVTDNGLGIPASEQPHIFEKFFRVERGPAQRVGGTGLGLALAHEIVLAHDGRMGFESTEGVGSRFWFELPTQ